MTATMRACAGHADFPAISDFIYTLYQPDNRDGNWIQPIWEYAYTHPLFDDNAVDRIGIWEDDGIIIAVAHYELKLGEAFFQVHPDYQHLKPEMLDYAEENLGEVIEDDTRIVRAFVADFDHDFEAIVRARGYELPDHGERPTSQFVIPDPFPPIKLPDGFRLKSLADDNDLVKVDRVLWRGFDHPGEPDADSLDGCVKMQSGPNYRKDLTIVVEAPNGDFVSFSGLWYEPANRIALVEPVATDPDYRRMGLGTAAVLEGIRRCGESDADVAYVGADMPFYLAMGFEKLFVLNCWIKTFDV